MCMRYQIMIGMVCLGRCFRHGVDFAAYGYRGERPTTYNANY